MIYIWNAFFHVFHLGFDVFVHQHGPALFHFPIFEIVLNNNATFGVCGVLQKKMFNFFILYLSSEYQRFFVFLEYVLPYIELFKFDLNINQ